MGRSNELMSQIYPANGQPARAGPRWRCGNCASLHSLWLGDSLIRPCVPLTGALRTIDLEPSALFHPSLHCFFSFPPDELHGGSYFDLEMTDHCPLSGACPLKPIPHPPAPTGCPVCGHFSAPQYALGLPYHTCVPRYISPSPFQTTISFSEHPCLHTSFFPRIQDPGDDQLFCCIYLWPLEQPPLENQKQT